MVCIPEVQATGQKNVSKVDYFQHVLFFSSMVYTDMNWTASRLGIVQSPMFFAIN